MADCRGDIEIGEKKRWTVTFIRRRSQDDDDNELTVYMDPAARATYFRQLEVKKVGECIVAVLKE